MKKLVLDMGAIILSFVSTNLVMYEFSLLREGNVHSTKDWRTVLEPIAARYRERDIPRYFRGDAAFANPEIHEYLESEHFRYAIRLPAKGSTVGP